MLLASHEYVSAQAAVFQALTCVDFILDRTHQKTEAAQPTPLTGVQGERLQKDRLYSSRRQGSTATAAVGALVCNPAKFIDENPAWLQANITFFNTWNFTLLSDWMLMLP